MYYHKYTILLVYRRENIQSHLQNLKSNNDMQQDITRAGKLQVETAGERIAI